MKGQAVFVTGASGFIGSHLVRRLLEEGAEVHALVRRDSDPSRIADIKDEVVIHDGDITDANSIRRCIRDARPDAVFHLASYVNAERDPELIEPMINVNLKGTVNLLRAVSEEGKGLGRFVNIGVSDEYGDNEVPFTEDQRENPISPYSASNVATTYYCHMFYKIWQMPVVTLRLFLTYGPSQSVRRMFIPSLIRHCLEGKEFPMTEGNQTREFNYVSDSVEGIVLAAKTPGVEGEVINIGCGLEYKVRDVAEKIVAMVGRGKLLAGALKRRPGKTDRFFCNNEKAKKLLGWCPEVSLEEGLERTICWYKEHLSSQI